jgi:hypothetical protein
MYTVINNYDMYFNFYCTYFAIHMQKLNVQWNSSIFGSCEHYFHFSQLKIKIIIVIEIQ